MKRVFSDRKYFSILLILLSAVFFRWYAFDWGIPENGISFSLPHPDETSTMHALMGIDPPAGNFVPRAALIEGTFSYYIWYIVSVILYLAGLIHSLPAHMNQTDFYTVLSAGRIIMGLCDAVTAYLIYKILLRLNVTERLSLIGAAIYVIIPIAVLHSHYMRPHIFLNAFIVSIIYLSLKFKDEKNSRSAVFIGLLSGACFACRYPFGIVISIPFLFIISDLLYARKQILNEFFNRYNLFLILTFIISFLIFVPTLVTDFQTFGQAMSISSYYTLTDQFKGSNIFDLDRIIRYLIYVIPKSTYALYIPLYLFTLTGFFYKSNHKIYLPLLVFSALYLYPFAKGYPLYVMRIPLAIMPILVITSVLGVSELLKSGPGYRLKNGLIYIVVIISMISTLFFDIAMIRGLNKKNPHQQLAEYINKNYKDINTILLFAPDWEYYEFENITKLTQHHRGIKILNENQVKEQNIKPELIVIFQFDGSKEVASKMREVLSMEILKSFELEKTFSVPVDFAGFSFDYGKMPHDFRYFCPDISVYKLKNS